MGIFLIINIGLNSFSCFVSANSHSSHLWLKLCVRSFQVLGCPRLTYTVENIYGEISNHLCKAPALHCTERLTRDKNLKTGMCYEVFAFIRQYKCQLLLGKKSKIKWCECNFTPLVLSWPFISCTVSSLLCHPFLRAVHTKTELHRKSFSCSS